MTTTGLEDGRGISPPIAFEGEAAREQIVLLHGFFSSPLSMIALARTLRAAGYAVHAPRYASWRAPLADIVETLLGSLPVVRDGHVPLHFVGHSMGGLVAQALASHIEPERLGRIVMIGTPNGGSELADYLAARPVLAQLLGQARDALVTGRGHPLLQNVSPPQVPLGVIAGDRAFPGPLRLLPVPHDGKVSVASTHCAWESDHIVLPVSHSLMPFDPRVHKQVRSFLAQGRFHR